MTEPTDMVLHCPACGLQHIDARTPCTARNCESGCALPGDCLAWPNPPHRSHLCHGCGHIWRPADVPTNGVRAVLTKGKADSPIEGCRAGYQHFWFNQGMHTLCKHCGKELPFLK